MCITTQIRYQWAFVLVFIVSDIGAVKRAIFLQCSSVSIGGCYAAGFVGPDSIDICRCTLTTFALKAIETRCHIGESILYDTVGKKGWSVDVRTHRITEIINRVLNEDWDDSPSDLDHPEEEVDVKSSFWAFWGWPGRGPRRRGPEGGDDGDDKKSPRKKKNPYAVPKAETEEDCVDCFRW